jgi:hypothetical protein
MEESLYFLQTLGILGPVGLRFTSRHGPGEVAEECPIDGLRDPAKTRTAVAAEICLVAVDRLAAGTLQRQLDAADITEVSAWDVGMPARRA